MAAGNGQDLHDPRLRADIPVIGQPAIIGATVLAVMKCPCGAPPLTLVTQMAAAGWQAIQAVCTGCQTPYHIQDVTADPQGRLAMNLAVGSKLSPT